MTTNQSNKELAIALAKKLCDGYIWIHDDADGFMYHKSTDDDLDIEQYLEQKAKDILFMKGMAEKIGEAIENNDPFGNPLIPVCNFFTGYENNGTLSPQKVITVFLELED